MRKAVCIIILFSMMLHCATRLGVVSYLYAKRHQVAISVGLIKEVPITICKSDDFSKSSPLVIVDTDTQDQNVPIQFTHTSEINLFFEPATTDIPEKQTGIALTHHTLALVGSPSRPTLSILHPPS